MIVILDNDIRLIKNEMMNNLIKYYPRLNYGQYQKEINLNFIFSIVINFNFKKNLLFANFLNLFINLYL